MSPISLRVLSGLDHVTTEKGYPNAIMSHITANTPTSTQNMKIKARLSIILRMGIGDT